MQVTWAKSAGGGGLMRKGGAELQDPMVNSQEIHLYWMRATYYFRHFAQDEIF